MASVYPAMRGQFGSTEFFLVTMKAGEVANQLIIPKEMPDWDDMDIEEKFQREINYKRVKDHIAPYLANDPDRFFGSLIVDVLNSENMAFESMGSFNSKIPKLYQTAADALGFLTLSGGEMLVPLDGQHRLAAIKFAITGKDEKSKSIDGIDANTTLANDDVTLLLVRHHPDKARKIFNKVNRYAKATSRSDNLITADDDIVAIISREIVSDKLIGGRIVNYESNTLSAKSECFTTLNTVYEATRRLLENQFGKISDQALPAPAAQTVYKDFSTDFWRNLLDVVETYRMAVHDVSEGGDDLRRQIRSASLLGKPIAQLALALAVSRLREAEGSNGKKLSWQDIGQRVNDVDWNLENPLWQAILMNGSKVVTGKQSASFAARFIACYLGEPLKDAELKALKNSYLNNFVEEERSRRNLPERLYAVF